MVNGKVKELVVCDECAAWISRMPHKWMLYAQNVLIFSMDIRIAPTSFKMVGVCISIEIVQGENISIVSTRMDKTIKSVMGKYKNVKRTIQRMMNKLY